MGRVFRGPEFLEHVLGVGRGVRLCVAHPLPFRVFCPVRKGTARKGPEARSFKRVGPRLSPAPHLCLWLVQLRTPGLQEAQ